MRGGAASFLHGLVFGLLVVASIVFGGLVVLEVNGRLKAPTFTNRWSVDEKLHFMRQRGPQPADILFVGSSTTFWGVDPQAYRSVLGEDKSLLNVGARGLGIDKAGQLTDFYMDIVPGITHVVMIVTYHDFEFCSGSPLLNEASARRYIHGEWPEVVEHLWHLDLVGVLGAADSIHLDRQQPRHDFESKNFDETGSVRLDVATEEVPETVARGTAPRIDPICYAALSGLAGMLSERGIDFTLVLSPLAPTFQERFDSDGSVLSRHLLAIGQALEAARPGCRRFINAHKELSLGQGSFIDAYHLAPEGVTALSQHVAGRLQSGC